MINFIRKEKASTIFAICICALSLLVCIARYLPTNVGNVFKTNEIPMTIMDKSDISLEVNCEIEDDGTYKIAGPDPQILFEVENKDIEAIKVNFALPVKDCVSIEIFTALDGEAFSLETRHIGSVLKGESDTIIDLPKGDYKALKVDINSEEKIVFKSVALFDKQPDMVPYTPIHTTKGYILTVLIPSICAVLAFFANKHFKICEKIASKIKHNLKTLVKFLLLTAVAVLMGAVFEWILCQIERLGVFSPYRWLFFFGVLEIVVVFIVLRKQLEKKPENLFLPLAFIMGFVILFGTPMKHICWDLDSHYPWAVHASFSDTAYITESCVSIDYVEPETMYNSSKFTIENYKEDIEVLNKADDKLISVTDAAFSPAHLPAGLVMAVARMFGATFSVRYNLGRMTYLIIYVFVCYFAIKKIKSGKMILSTICLFPTVIFMATNYAYDSWVVAFSVLGMSYFMSMLQEPEKDLNIWDTIVMCAAFALAALPKLVYVIMMLIPFFIFKKWKRKSDFWKYYSILASSFLVVFAIFAIVSLTEVSGTGDLRGGAVNPIEQIKHILSDPINYCKLLTKFLRDYLSIDGMQGYISNMAYFGIGKWWPIFVLLLGFTAVTDANSQLKFKIPLTLKILAIIFFVGMSALIATALYISFTPVAHTTVLGCQPRYIIPLLAPTILLVTGQRKDIIKPRGTYNGFVLMSASAAFMLDLYSSIITKMV